MVAIRVRITPETRDLLKLAGRKGETYEAIIRKLLRSSEYVEFMDEQYRILRTETDWHG